MSTPALPPKPEAILHETRRGTPDQVSTSQTKISRLQGTSAIDSNFLDSCSEEELQSLLDNPQLLDAFFVAHHPQLGQYVQELEARERRNDKIRARIEELHPELLEKKFEVENSLMKAKELERRWEETEREMYRSMQCMSSSAIKSRLQGAVMESQSTTESMLASFLEFGPVLQTEDLQDFIKEYRQQRKTFHLRSARLARMKEERVSGFR